MGFINGTKIAIARPKTGMCAFLAATSFRWRMSASSVYFLRTTNGAPIAEEEPVAIRFGTTTVPDSKSQWNRCSLRPTCCGGASRRTERTERDDRATSGTTRCRTGRRSGERDDGVGIAIDEARWRGRGRAPRVRRQNPLLTDRNGGKLPTSSRYLIEIDLGNSRLLSESLPNFVWKFRYRPVH
jgi:hypothetical protein